MKNLKEIFVFNGNGDLEIVDLREVGLEGWEFDSEEVEVYFRGEDKIVEYVGFDGVGRVRFDESKISEEEVLRDIVEFDGF
jgi:hypothetical protein